MNLKSLVGKLKRDNKGAALVLVLLVALLVSMLVSLLLVATVSNSKMKSIQRIENSGQNVADSAIEDLTLGLEELADTAMRTAYTKMLSIYSGTVQSARLEYLKSQFSNYIVELITKNLDDSLTAIDPSDAEKHVVSKERLEEMLKNASGGAVELIASDAIPITYRVNDDNSVVIVGVKIRYVDDNGFETIITTDIRFNIPASLVDVSRVSDDIDFKSFILITDGSIKRDNTDRAFIIDGNAYTGAGAIVDGGILTVNSDLFISRNTIKVNNAGQFLAPKSNTELWVRNIETGENATNVQVATPWININGKCYVADDLSLNADYANVTISGEYYGYHSINSTSLNPNGDASGSSAIIINAKNAKLDLQACSTLNIFGKTYLSVPSYYYDTSNPDPQLEALRHDTIMQGESLSFKGVQAAYMVPGNCIIGYNHNPLTEDEYNELVQAIADGSPTKRIALGENVKNGGIDLEKYVDTTAAKPYKACFVTYYGKNAGNRTKLVYLYLDFSSPNKAAEYFMEYYDRYKPRVENLATALKIGEILLGADRMVTGNLIFTDADKNLEFAEHTNDYADPVVIAKEISYTRKYNGLITYLDEYYYTNDTSKTVCDLLIHFRTNNVEGEYLEAMPSEFWEGFDGYVYNDDDEGHNSLDKHPFVLITPNSVDVTVAGGKYSITTKNTSTGDVIKNHTVTAPEGLNCLEGLILSAGEVTINGANVNGMIIAKRGITLKGEATVTANDFYQGADGTGYYHYMYHDIDAEGNLLASLSSGYMKNVSDLIKHDKRIYKWFKTYNPAGVEDSNGAGENGVKIVFENWTKNN